MMTQYHSDKSLINCNKCKKDKAETDFYPRNKVCKDCTKLRVSIYQKGIGKEVADRAKRKYDKTEKGKIARKKSEDNYFINHAERKRCHWRVKSAIRSGLLVRPSNCDECGRKCSPHAHHGDYTKSLDVNWLCRLCHESWHRNNNPIYSHSGDDS